MDLLECLLVETNFDITKRKKLISGFRLGFDLGYRGPCTRTNISNNLPFTVGNATDMWNKIMKEVKLKQYAGPYQRHELPFDNFVQSLIGLVPKAGTKTRLIFHFHMISMINRRVDQ